MTAQTKIRWPLSVGLKEPTMFLQGFGIQAVLIGISLLAPGKIFAEQPTYYSLAKLPIPEEVWGLVMTVDGLAVFLVSTLAFNQSVKAAVASVTGLLWLFLGIEMLLGAAVHHFFSPGGAWAIFGGVGCFMAMMQIGRSAG